MTAENLLQRIVLEPGKRGGKPCIRGMRITPLPIGNAPASDQLLSLRSVGVATVPWS